MACNLNCIDEILVANQPTCDLKIRKRGIARIGFMVCSTDFPTPLSCVNLETIVGDGSLVFSSELANIEVVDPEFEDIIISDCRPALQVLTQRVINFNDNLPIDIAAGGSPYVAPQPFFNYTFWYDKLQKQSALRAIIIFCDGSITIPRDENGEYMETTLNAFTSYERSTGNNPYTREFIKGTLTFKGDPFALYNKPELDSDGNVFNIGNCDINY